MYEQKILEEQVKDFLGDYNTLEVAIKYLTLIANGEYKAEQLENDVNCHSAVLAGYDHA